MPTAFRPNMRALLDVNVLIALLYAVHMHHARANQWLQQHMVHGLLGHRGLGPATGLGCGAIAAVGRLKERLGQRWRHRQGQSRGWA